jgi:O-Antigen ligase
LPAALGASAERSLAGLVVPATAAVAVFVFACGSSSVQVLLDVGRPGRWVALVLLLAVSAVWASERGRHLEVPLSLVVATAFVVLLAAVSTTWSIDPHLTFERAVTIAILAVTALLIAQAVAGREAASERLLIGLVAGSVLVALAGLLVLAVSHRDAVAIATTDVPARFRGMGQDPNTASLLFAVATPIATWLVVSVRPWPRRLAAVAVLALLVASIVASGSHGAVIAAGAGCGVAVVVAAGSRRAAVLAGAAVVVAVGLALFIETFPQPSASNPPAAAAAPSPPARPGYLDAEINTPLDGELGIPLPGQPVLRRTLSTSSGRTQAWGGAIHQAEQRPVAGYGFGTESNVFIDRWWRFVGSVPENSYIGIALQLGIAGLVGFGALLATLGSAALAAIRRDRHGFAAASVGVLAAALVAAIVQSYIYSVGNIATLTVWVAVFLLASAERARV